MIDQRLEKIATEFAACCLYVTIIQEGENVLVNMPKPFEDFGITLFLETLGDGVTVIVWESYAGTTIREFWTYDCRPKYILSQVLLLAQTWDNWINEHA